ncbi:MAG: 23S rRNA (uridine(2552)-2'-O)-methyltransferase RlmE [Legionellales bacterium]|nr:23S rRNA (uridine(2552)-2'-O)-methyltransferase RlmE [Legionellales bacterium]
MSQSKSSKRWLTEHFNDPYVKQAQRDGYRSRAAYKLIELQQKYRLIQPGMRIVDLGAAPGGWSQLASQWVQPTGTVVAVDLLPIEPLPNVVMVQGDFREQAVLQCVLEKVGDQRVDVVLSDMAPNLSGNHSIDIPRSMYLAELALDMVGQILKPRGSLVMKLFHGVGFEDLLRQVRLCFTTVQVRKPKASRARSKEVYLVAKGYTSNE